jgi:hypothetical protein
MLGKRAILASQTTRRVARLRFARKIWKKLALRTSR